MTDSGQVLSNPSGETPFSVARAHSTADVAAPWRVISLCALANMFDGYDIQALGLAIPHMSGSLNIPAPAFAPAASGSLVGMAAGAFFISPLADGWGARRVLVCAVLLIGLSSLATASARGMLDLTFWRVLTGIGMGAVLPIAIGLTAEHAPPRVRTRVVTLMMAGGGAGSFAASFIAPLLVSGWGWQGIFLVGGLLPLTLAILMWLGLPRAAPERPRAPRSPVSAVGALITGTLRARTILFWLIIWLSLFVVYSLLSWLPTLLVQDGWPTASASRAMGMVAVGGIIGGIMLAWLIDHGRMIGPLAAAYMISAGVLLTIGIASPGAAAWGLLLVLLGLCTLGAQITLGPLSAAFYPAEVRATGIGWSGGIGRIGAFTGPLAVAGLMQSGFAPHTVLGLLLLPMLACACCVLLLPRALRSGGLPFTLQRSDD